MGDGLCILHSSPQHSNYSSKHASTTVSTRNSYYSVYTVLQQVNWNHGVGRCNVTVYWLLHTGLADNQLLRFTNANIKVHTTMTCSIKHVVFIFVSHPVFLLFPYHKESFSHATMPLIHFVFGLPPVSHLKLDLLSVCSPAVWNSLLDELRTSEI